MNNSSRVKNSVKNVGIGTALQIVALILSFVTRSIFIKLLGIEYLSVDGLFSNILTLLNFTELGIGSAIIYSLYKPIAEKDYNKIGALMNLFKHAYRYIAGVILILGVCVIPFLQYIIKDVPNVLESLSLLYSLFLLNSVCTYVYGYKKSLLIADQKNYVVLIIYQIVHTCQILVQIGVLFITHNYIIYLLILIGCTLINNIICTKYVDRKYNWLKQYIHNKITKDEQKIIFGNIKSIAFYKFGAVLLNGTNNIVISTFVKTTLVGFCSNYMLVINAITTIINQGMSGLMASVGNYNVKASDEDNQKVFEQLDFLMFTVLSFICIGLCIFLNDFIVLWLGEKYVLSNNFVFTIVLSFYVLMINTIPSTFRVAMGMFKKAKYFPAIAAIINLILSIIFAKIIGFVGVFWANIIARFLCYTMVDATLLYTNKFKYGILSYIKTYFIRILFCALVLAIVVMLDSYIKNITSYHTRIFFIKPIIFMLTFAIAYFICWYHSEILRSIVRKLTKK